MERRCEAITTKGRRCRKKAEYYCKYTDGREYLSCKQHELYFRPHPGVIKAKTEVANANK